MNDTDVFRRYLFLGTDQPFYIRKNKPLDIQDGLRIMSPIAMIAKRSWDPNDVAAKQAAENVNLSELPVETIKKAIESGALTRHDECLFALAYMIRIYKPADRTKVYAELPTLIKSSKDLFQFLHFYKVLGPVGQGGSPEGESAGASKEKRDEKLEEESSGKPKDSAEMPEKSSSDKPRKKQKVGFGNGIKVAIRKWYDKHTAEELAVMLATDRTWYDWCHADILKMAHLNLKDVAKMQVFDAVCGGEGVMRPPKPKAKKNKGKSKAFKTKAPDADAAASGGEAKMVTTESETEGESTTEEAKAQDSDVASGGEGKIEPTEPVIEAVEVQAQSKALGIFKRIKEFKSLQKVNEATCEIKRHKYSLELVPSQLHRAAGIWESLFPHMPYRDIVQAALVLQDYKLLKETDSTLSKAYGESLHCMKSVAKSNVSPIFVYQIMRLFEERQRYLCAVKEAIHTANNLALKNAKANPTVLKQFYKVLNESIQCYQPSGTSQSSKQPNKKDQPTQSDQSAASDQLTQADQPSQPDQSTQSVQLTKLICQKKLNILVTLDLRSKQSKKRVFNNRLMSCQAAYILLTFPLLKHNDFLKVLSFTEDKSKLIEVDFTREMDFFAGCDHIQNHANRKTVVDITQPIKHAKQEKMAVDVFLTIVDSLIRVNPKRVSPVDELNSYNRTTGKQARYIVVSLSRHQQDFNHTNMNSTKGVLELVGCSEETPVVIDAYMKKHFM